MKKLQKKPAVNEIMSINQIALGFISPKRGRKEAFKKAKEAKKFSYPGFDKLFN